MTVNRRHIIRSEAFDVAAALHEAERSGEPAVGPWLLYGCPRPRRHNPWAWAVLVLLCALAVQYFWMRG